MRKTRKATRLLSLLLSVLLLGSVLPVAVLAEESAAPAAPDLEIGTKAELIAFAERVNGGETFEGKLVVLTDDIDLEGMAWTPIGYDSYGTDPEEAVCFRGTFDGRGHTVSNLTDAGYVPTIVTGGEYGFGLFGYAYGATFKNVTLANVSIHADGLSEGDGAGVAALVGYYRIKNGTPFAFENCHLESGSVYATNNMGGLVGYMYGYALAAENYTFLLDGRFVNCTNKATVITKKREVGGILGLFDMAADRSLKVKGDLLFDGCKNYGTVTAEASNAGNSCAGGIFGRDNTGALWYFGGRIVFDGCYNSGTVTAYGNPGDEIHASGMGTVYNVGGMTAAVKNCTNEGAVATVGSDVAFCGEILACSGYAMIENCTVTDYKKLYGGVSRMLFVEQPGVEINEDARALLYLNGAKAPKILTFGESGGKAEKNIVSKENYLFDGWYTTADFSGESVTFNNGGNDSGIFYAKFITLEEAYGRAAAGDTITFGADIAAQGLVIDKDITIDLGGCTYTVGAASPLARAAVGGLQILPGASVTVKNGTIAGDIDGALVQNYGDLTLENVTLDGRELGGDKRVLSAEAGATSVKDSTVIAAADGTAIDVRESGAYGNASVTLENTKVIGGVELTDENGGEFTGKLVAGGEEITETGTYVQYDEAFFYRMDTYALTLSVDKTELQAGDTLHVTVAIDKDYYAAEYTFTYDTAIFTCGADTDGDGRVLVTNLFRGTAGELATYTLSAKNDITAATVSHLSLEGNVIQYKEQLLNSIESTVVGDTEAILVSLSYTATVKADYVQGYSLVLIEGDDAGYAFGGIPMFYVEAYGAYATLVEGAVTAEEIDAALSKSDACTTLRPSYDVNAGYVDDGVVDLKDATAVYACSVLDFDVLSYVELYLRADVNGDWVVNMVDINAVSAAYSH